MDNIFIERLWRPLKYDCVYLEGFSAGRQKIGQWFGRYNRQRLHSSHGILTPQEVYYDQRADFGGTLDFGLGPSQSHPGGGNCNTEVHLSNAAKLSNQPRPSHFPTLPTLQPFQPSLPVRVIRRWGGSNHSILPPFSAPAPVN